MRREPERSAPTVAQPAALAAGIGNRAAAALLQRMPADEMRLGAWYMVRGWEQPLRLFSKSRIPAPWFGFQLPGVPATIRVGEEDDVVREVDAPAPAPAQPAPGGAPEPRTVALTAVWDAERRVFEALKLLDRAFATGQPTPRQRARLAREADPARDQFRMGLVRVLGFIRTRLAGSRPAGLILGPDETGLLGERAETDRARMTISLHRPFFADADRSTRAATIIHECVHAVLGTDDAAYKTARAFAFLTDAARVGNPDSFVALIEELEGVAEPTRAQPLTAAAGVGADVRAEAAYRVALAQHVLQRASYLFAGIERQTQQEVAFSSWGRERRWFHAYRDGRARDRATLNGLARGFSIACRRATSLLAFPIEVVALAAAPPAQPWVREQDRLSLTYCRTPNVASVASPEDKVVLWLVATALSAAEVETPNPVAKAAWACVAALEPYAGRLAPR